MDGHIIKAPTPNPKYYMYARCQQPTDLIVIREIWSENVYEVFDGDLVDTHIVVDVGANIGAFSIYMHSLNPKAKVYAFEPEQHNYDLLVENIALNNLGDSIVPVGFAVGQYSKETTIDDEGGDSIIGRGNQKVRMISLRTFWQDEKLEFIDVLKIDVEGYEANVLRGMPDGMLNLCRYVVVEYDRNAPTEDFNYIVSRLSETHQLKIVGSHKTGAYIYGRRY